MMRKNSWHFLVDLLSYVAMLGLAATGLMLLYRLPHGACHRTLFGVNRHEWGDIHGYLAFALLALVALHVFLHWRWVRNTFCALFTARPKKPGAGRAGTAMLLGLGLVTAAVVAAPWLGSVGEGREGGRGVRGGRGQTGEHATDHGCDDTHVRGRTTLAQAAELAGVTVPQLAAKLKLPSDTPGDSRLGQLSQEHGFAIDDVRAIVDPNDSRHKTCDGHQGGSQAGGGRPRDDQAGGHGPRGQQGGGRGQRGQQAGGEGRGRGGSGRHIRGRDTLADAAELAGVTVRQLAAELKLPPDTPGHSRLRPLSEEYGFDMGDMRAVVARLRPPEASPEPASVAAPPASEGRPGTDRK